MQLQTEELTKAAFAPYGQVIEQPARPSDATGPGWEWWAAMASMQTDGRGVDVGYLRLQPPELQFDWAERHMYSQEIILPTEDCLVYVGPADDMEQPDKLPPLEAFHVFRIRKGQGMILNRGVWHGAPFAVSDPGSCFIFLLQGTSAQDVHLVRWDEPVQIVMEDRR